MRCSKTDEAVTLIRRLVDASTTISTSPSSRGEVTTTNGNGNANGNDTITKVIKEMRDFLLLECGGEMNTTNTDTDYESDSDSRSGGENPTTFELSIGGRGDFDGARILRVEVLEPELRNDTNDGDGDVDSNDNDGDGNGDEEIDNDNAKFFDVDLSSDKYTIGDAGCSQLAQSLSTANGNNTTCNIYIRTLDLEANGLSAVSGFTLATAVIASTTAASIHTIPLFSRLQNLNLGCNGIGPDGFETLALQLCHLPHLESLDLHGNGIADKGCVALSSSLCALKFLRVLDLSANRIENAGAAALGVLFQSDDDDDDDGGESSSKNSKRQCCCRLTTLNLRENGIESIDALISDRSTSTDISACELEALDLSWNSIVSFDALLENKYRYPKLTELELKGNALSDAECVSFCSKFDLELDDSDDDNDKNHRQISDGHEDEKKDDDSSTSQIQQQNIRPMECSESRLRVCLRRLADNHATNASICQLVLWQSTSTTSNITNNVLIHPTKEEELAQQKHINVTSSRNGTTIPSEEMDAFPSRLRRDGFVVQPPLAQDMKHLSATMNRIENAGYPPVFCFMNDTFWDFVTTQVWPMVSSLLGVDNDDDDCCCLLDSGSAFAWSLKATGKSTFPRDGEFRSWQNAVSSINNTVPKEKEEEGYRGFGSSFGLPHRDYSAADSLHCDGDDDDEDHHSSPAVLNVWIPLNDATNDNGCMYVVPREFDSDFARTDGHHAHMNPATEVQRGVSSKIHFPLHGVRALPAPAGSLIAWYGNTIHWGSSCSKYAKDPRKSIALTFIRSDCNALSSSNTTTTKNNENENESRIHNPSPPISITQAAAMTPEMRLSLISRSLLIYNQWHALADDAVPPLIYKTTEVQEKI